MANLKAEFHEQYDEETNICLLESHLKMSKPHVNVVSFDENVSYLSTSMNLYERNKQFFMNKTATELTGPCKHWHRLPLINRAGGLYGRILTEVVSTDRTQ